MSKKFSISALADKMILFGLWIFSLSLLVSKSGLDTAVTIITLGAGMKFFSKRAQYWQDFPSEIKKLFVLWVIFAVLETVGIMWSSDVISSVKRVIIHLGYIGLMMGIILLPAPIENIRKSIQIISLILIGVSVIALIQYFAGYDFPLGRTDEITKGGRVMGTLGYPNDMGMLLGVLLPFMVAIFLYDIGTPAIKFIHLISLMGGVAVLLLTFTRGAWLGSFAGLSFMFFIKKDKRSWLFAAFAFVAIILLVFPPVKRRAIEVFSSNFSQQETTRKFFLKKVPLMILEKPLLGHGTDTFRKNFYSRYPEFPEKGHFHPHNVYLSIAYQTGVVGLAVWLGMFYFAFAPIIRKVFTDSKDNFPPFNFALVWGAVGAGVSFFIHGFVDEVFRAYEAPYALLFILSAGLVGVYSIFENKSSPKEIS